MMSRIGASYIGTTKMPGIQAPPSVAIAPSVYQIPGTAAPKTGPVSTQIGNTNRYVTTGTGKYGTGTSYSWGKPGETVQTGDAAVRYGYQTSLVNDLKLRQQMLNASGTAKQKYEISKQLDTAQKQLSTMGSSTSNDPNSVKIGTGLYVADRAHGYSPAWKGVKSEDIQQFYNQRLASFAAAAKKAAAEASTTDASPAAHQARLQAQSRYAQAINSRKQFEQGNASLLQGFTQDPTYQPSQFSGGYTPPPKAGPKPTSSYSQPQRASAGMSTGALPGQPGSGLVMGGYGGAFGGQGGGAPGNQGGFNLGMPFGGGAQGTAGGYGGSGGYQSPVVSPDQLANVYGAAINREDQLAQGGAGLLQNVDTGYQDYAQSAQQREGELTNYLTGLGNAEKSELQRSRDVQAAAAQQSLSARGLGNTTVQDAAMRGVNFDYHRALSQVNEKLTREKMDYRAALSGDTLAARKTALENRRGSIGEWYAMGHAGAGTLKDLGAALAEQQKYRWGAQSDLAKAQLEAQTAMARIGADERLGQQGLVNQAQAQAQQRQLDLYRTQVEAQNAQYQAAMSKEASDAQARAQVAASPTGLRRENVADRSTWGPSYF